MEKFYEKSLIYYVFLKFQKKVCDFGDFTKMVLESFKMTDLEIRFKIFTQQTVHLYFKKKLIFILPPNMSNFLLVCFILTLM
jgi:hypothetical protein